MTSRTTVAKVRQLFGPANAADTDIEAIHMVTAHTLVETNLADKNLADDLLGAIELFLSAHFLAISEERGSLTRSYTGDTEEWREGRTFTAGLGSTRFGQQAIALDPTGTLAKAPSASGTSGSKLPAQLSVV